MRATSISTSGAVFNAPSSESDYVISSTEPQNYTSNSSHFANTTVPTPAELDASTPPRGEATSGLHHDDATRPNAEQAPPSSSSPVSRHHHPKTVPANFRPGASSSQPAGHSSVSTSPGTSTQRWFGTTLSPLSAYPESSASMVPSPTSASERPRLSTDSTMRRSNMNSLPVRSTNHGEGREASAREHSMSFVESTPENAVENRNWERRHLVWSS